MNVSDEIYSDFLILLYYTCTIDITKVYSNITPL